MRKAILFILISLFIIGSLSAETVLASSNIPVNWNLNDIEVEEGVKVTFFDRDWQVMPFTRHYPKSEKVIEKPKNYELMIELAEKLSKNIPFVRVDFYEVNGKVYFGELTFFPGNGLEEFKPEEYDKMLGDYIDLEKVNG